MTSADAAGQSAPIQTAQVLSERFGSGYRWLVTITGMVGVVSMVLAMTTVNVAVMGAAVQVDTDDDWYGNKKRLATIAENQGADSAGPSVESHY